MVSVDTEKIGLESGTRIDEYDSGNKGRLG